MPLGGNRRVARRTARRTSRRQGMFTESSEPTYNEPAYTNNDAVSEPTEADQINELFELKEKGIITDEEFAEKKKQILGL